jgi:uridine kinase
VDDFFLGAGSLPKNPDGTYDMDHIDVVDTGLAERCIADLLEKGEADFPVFDFSAQRRGAEVRHISASGGSLVIIEGTHALNPLLTKGLPKGGVFRVFAGTNVKFCVDGKPLLLPEELRLVRRMLRDEQFRGWSRKKPSPSGRIS